MKSFFRLVLLALVLLVVALVSALTAMRLAIHGHEVAVPDLVGKSPAAARMIAEQSGLEVSVERQYYSPTLFFRFSVLCAQHQFEPYILSTLGAGRKCFARTKTYFVWAPMMLMQHLIDPRLRNLLSRLVLCLARIGNHGSIPTARENCSFE